LTPLSFAPAWHFARQLVDERRENNCRVQVSGKALASGFFAAQEPVASAIPLSYSFADL
jgi:hypothetical protein